MRNVKSMQYFLGCLFLLVSFTAVGAIPRGILWKISTADNADSYILGTIHSDLPEVTTIPRQVLTMLEQSQSFSAELDLNPSTILKAAQHMFLPGNQKVLDLIGKERFAKCVQLMREYGVPEMTTARMKPWAIALQLSMPKVESGMFLDLKLYQMAQARGLKLYGLESVDEQAAVFDEIDMKQQIIVLDDAIQDYPRLNNLLHEMINLYLQRDLNTLYEFGRTVAGLGSQEISQLVEERLITERNIRMVQRMQPRLQEGRAFIAVGALHLPGEQGILKLLQDMGYQVEPVY